MKRPNILIIMSDDQGPWAIHGPGAPELRTPNLDRLAAEGIRFENCFCASPVCSPARASFLTGRIPSQHGVHDWIRHGNMDDPEGRTWHGPETRTEYLEGLTAFTDLLADSGYTCGISGKWHLGASDVPQKSHDFWCVHSLGGGNYTDYWVFDNSTEMTHQTQYVTDYFTDRAIDFLDAATGGEKPFCLSVHYTAPHTPWLEEEQPADIWNSYADVAFSLPIEPPHPWNGWDPTPEDRHEKIQGYYTTITAMDRAIGRVLDKLDELGVADSTIVIFTSDNGFSVGQHGIFGKGNGTFPLNMYEESVKIPFIIRLPDGGSAGRIEDALVSHYDILPTFCEWFDLPLPEAKSPLPGVSFLPLLQGESGPTREEVILFDEYGPVRMIRTPTDKYVHRFPYGPHEYYNLETDPGETTNLLASDLEAVQERIAFLRGQLLRWFKKHVVPALDGSRLPVTGNGQLASIPEMLEGAEGFGPKLVV